MRGYLTILFSLLYLFGSCLTKDVKEIILHPATCDLTLIETNYLPENCDGIAYFQVHDGFVRITMKSTVQEHTEFSVSIRDKKNEEQNNIYCADHFDLGHEDTSIGHFNMIEVARYTSHVKCVLDFSNFGHELFYKWLHKTQDDEYEYIFERKLKMEMIILSEDEIIVNPEKCGNWENKEYCDAVFDFKFYPKRLYDFMNPNIWKYSLEKFNLNIKSNFNEYGIMALKIISKENSDNWLVQACTDYSPVGHNDVENFGHVELHEVSKFPSECKMTLSNFVSKIEHYWWRNPTNYDYEFYRTRKLKIIEKAPEIEYNLKNINTFKTYEKVKQGSFERYYCEHPGIFNMEFRKMGAGDQEYKTVCQIRYDVGLFFAGDEKMRNIEARCVADTKYFCDYEIKDRQLSEKESHLILTRPDMNANPPKAGALACPPHYSLMLRGKLISQFQFECLSLNGENLSWATNVEGTTHYIAKNDQDVYCVNMVK